MQTDLRNAALADRENPITTSPFTDSFPVILYLLKTTYFLNELGTSETK